jgi:hypothetical protein
MRSNPLHNPKDIDVLYQNYVQTRIQAQLEFYEYRIAENSFNSTATFSIATWILGLSSFVSAITAINQEFRWLTVVGALLPAVAALLASFRQLYGWDRQMSIYRDASLGLRKSLLIVPDDDDLESTAALDKIYKDLLVTVEDVLRSEVSQWGQYLSEKEEGGSPDENTVIKSMFASMNLDDQQATQIRAILDSARIRATSDLGMPAVAGTATAPSIAGNTPVDASAQAAGANLGTLLSDYANVTPRVSAEMPAIIDAPTAADYAAAGMAIDGTQEMGAVSDPNAGPTVAG